MRKLIIGLIFGFLYSTTTVSAQVSGMRAMPHVIVYKTRANYRDLVPVMLSKDKKKIVSYPGPGDVKTGSGYALPVLLHKGYLLDRRGVGINTAFLKFTYEQYGNLKTVPSPGELYKMIVDKDPITEICDCGVRMEGKNSVEQLNELIDSKKLKKKCKAYNK
jgi:hypothetical protein